MIRHSIVRCLLALLVAGSPLLFTSCTENIDESNRYTFTGETIQDYLENRPELYSSFLTILKRAGMSGLLSSYGSYTCLAPTNEAVTAFLKEKDSIYWRNVYLLEHDSITLKEFVETGIHSPKLEDLSDSMAIDIARNHLIEKGYLTTDLNEGAFPEMNMNDRYLTISWVADANGATQVKVNNSSTITKKDEEVENGVVQTLDKVLSPSTALLPDLIKSQDYFSIFAEALYKTGLDDSMRLYKDPTYTMAGKTTLNFDQNRQCPYPKSKYYKYTAFVESNEVFNKYGIKDINDLITFANKWYGTQGGYTNVDLQNYTSPKNPLYRFVAYHLLNRQLQYASGSGPQGFIMQNYKNAWSGFDSEVNLRAGYDRYDYFETFLHTLVKVTKPLSNSTLKSEIVLNYAQDKGTRLYNSELANHLNVIVLPQSKVTATTGMEGFTQSALNGIIHCIDRIMVYNESEMAGNILNERMRFDFSSLFPELTNNSIRWAQKSSTEQEYILPDGYCAGIKMNSEDCHLYYLCANGGSYSGWTNYEGDEFIATKTYDFVYTLPPVPSGTYEIRIGYDRNSARGVAQFYIDGKVTGIPADLRYNTYTENLVGWIVDSGDEDVDKANDKAMRNRGYMKGPDNVCPTSGVTCRSTPYSLRKIVTTTYLSGNMVHTFRMKNVLNNDDGKSQGMHDWLEIVPKGVITDTSHPEDRH